MLISSGALLEHSVYQANPGIIALKAHYDERQPVCLEKLCCCVSVAFQSRFITRIEDLLNHVTATNTDNKGLFDQCTL